MIKKMGHQHLGKTKTKEWALLFDIEFAKYNKYSLIWLLFFY